MQRALDLFCGAGGAAVGLKQAGFDEVVGIDNQPQPDYPFEFVQGDARYVKGMDDFDFIWASPPCQRYSEVSKGKASRAKYPHLIPYVRSMLLKTGKPFVIENVPGAPLRKDLMLCGEMFDLPLIRHRIFEVHGFEVRQPDHPKHKISMSNGTAISVSRYNSPGFWGDNAKRQAWREKYGKLYTLENKCAAMGIKHITTSEGICEAIPPAYSKYIGEAFIGGKP